VLHQLARLGLLLSLVLTASVSFALNENTTIVLHARDGFAPCDDPQQHGIDCINGLPNVDLSGMQMPWVYVMLRNYDGIGGIACAFDWPMEWNYLGGTWDCQQHMIVVLQPVSPGPVTGQLLTAFDCIQGGALATVGRMIFAAPSTAGCLSVINPNHPFGVHVANCIGGDDLIPPENRGRVCAGPGGYDACWPASTPVESATWGAIKSQYR
jgi:hypothetical protein